MRLLTKTMLAVSVAAVVAGCGDQVGPKLEKPVPVTSAVALFNPSAGAAGIPFPIDLMFNGTTDGSVNIPGAGTNPAFAAMNTLSGFSTTAPMVIRFSGPIDGATANVSGGVKLFETNATSPSEPVTAATSLMFGVDYAAGINGGVSGMIFPLKPLASAKTHLVVVTSDLKTRAGEAVGADNVYALGKGTALVPQAFPALTGHPLVGPLFTVAIPNIAVASETDPGTACSFTPPAVLDCVLNPAYVFLSDLDPANPPNPALVPAIVGAKQIVAGVLAQGLFQDRASPSDPMLINPAQAATVATFDIGLRPLIAEDFTALSAYAQDKALAESVDPADIPAYISGYLGKVVLSYRVTTQNIAAAQTQAVVQVGASTPGLSVLNPVSAWSASPQLAVVSPGTDGVVNNADDHSAHIYLATLNDIIQFVDPSDANSSHWEADENDWAPILQCSALTASTKLLACNQFKPTPKVSDHSIPVLVSAPRPELLAGDCAPLAASGLPVVIFQHGITANRGSLMALADTLAKACTVGVAIDLPKHGISSADSTFAGLGQLHEALSGGAVFERLVKVSSPQTECQARTGAAVGDGDFYCPSGDNFVNLTDLANARDTLRQAAVDLHSLYKALAEDNDFGPTTIGANIDTSKIHFVGMSLGGIVGGVFAANEPNLVTVTLNGSGGGIAKILDGSPSFEPQITAGLAANGVVKPGGDYEGFLIMAQTVVDSADPINFTAYAEANNTPVINPGLSAHKLLMQVVLNDQVVPNNTFGTSFGPAWGFVAQTGQNSFLLNQNFITVPVALSGSDALAQGTGFVVSASVANQNPALAGNVLQAGVLGGDNIIAAVNGAQPGTFPAGTTTFKGLGLPSITGECSAGRGVVRFTQGGHSSLLQPGASAGVTAAMQTQIASFVTQGSAALPPGAETLVFKGDVVSASNLPCP